MQTTTVLLVSLSSLLSLALADPCGTSDWRFSPTTHKCYKLFYDRISWTSAEYKCAFQGAHQISIHDYADNQFVAELARQAGIVWMGAVQFGTSQDYTWADRTPFGGYENWEGGYRPTYHKGKKCTKLDGYTGKWIQSCCKVPASFICQKPATIASGAIIEDDSGVSDDFRRTRLAFLRV